jgi:hypothetical protein
MGEEEEEEVGFIIRIPGFVSRVVHVGFMVEKVALV